jgi:hypothetical protein
VIPNSALPFSGGLVSQGLQRLGVHDTVLLRLRVAAIFILPLLAWLPLLLLSTFDGKLLPGSVGTPFLLDLSAHIRLLVALPLFILAARMGEARILPTLQQFLARRIVLGSSVPKFEAAVASAFRLGDSIAADLLIIAIIYFFDTLVARRTYVANDVSTWYAASAAQGSHLNPAGICYAYFIYDEKGNLVETITGFKFALGEPAPVINPSKRMGWTFGPGFNQLQQFFY